jgi:hypothetical protein
MIRRGVRWAFGAVYLVHWLVEQALHRVVRPHWRLEGRCRACGVCCQHIVLTLPRWLAASRRATGLYNRWYRWLYGFVRADRTSEPNGIAVWLQPTERGRTMQHLPPTALDLPHSAEGTNVGQTVPGARVRLSRGAASAVEVRPDAQTPAASGPG